jgi:glycosyltransferase involved in cell wall biosynthesis
VKDQTAIYAPLDVCVVPSRFREPFGLVAAEAGWAGLPVVAARRGGLPEIVADGETGFLVEAEQPKQLADQLQKLIQDPALRREMGEQGHERALEHFTRERMVNEIDELLVSLSR